MNIMWLCSLNQGFLQKNTTPFFLTTLPSFFAAPHTRRFSSGQRNSFRRGADCPQNSAVSASLSFLLPHVTRRKVSNEKLKCWVSDHTDQLKCITETGIDFYWKLLTSNFLPSVLFVASSTSSCFRSFFLLLSFLFSNMKKVHVISKERSWANRN